LEGQDRLVEVGLKHGIFTKEGGLYLDDTANPKKGKHSVGVKRQWCGVLGKEENCQVLPTLVYGAPKAVNANSVVWPLGIQLYLPEDWAEDEQRRDAAGVPGEIEFQTKTQIGLDMLERVRERVPHGFVGADAFYGRDSEFRKQLREWKDPYVVGLQPQRFNCIATTLKKQEIRSARDWASAVQWRTITWTEGTQEPLTARVARLRVQATLNGSPTEEEGWLLLEDREGEVHAWMCWGMDKASLKTLVTRAHHRWVIEDAHSLMKGELGLDHFEGRSWNGLHHHVTMVLIGLAFLQTLRVRAGDKSLAQLRAASGV
jgi:SRSO17 transposase